MPNVSVDKALNLSTSAHDYPMLQQINLTYLALQNISERYCSRNKNVCAKVTKFYNFSGTKWSNLSFFTESCIGEQRFVFSPTVDTKALFAYEKKVPEFTLMGMLFQ